MHFDKGIYYFVHVRQLRIKNLSYKIQNYNSYILNFKVVKT